MEKLFFFALFCFALVCVFLYTNQRNSKERTVCVCCAHQVFLSENWLAWCAERKLCFVGHTCWRVKCREQLVWSWNCSADLKGIVVWGFYWEFVPQNKGYENQNTAVWILTRTCTFWLNYSSVCLPSLTYVLNVWNKSVLCVIRLPSLSSQELRKNPEE